MTYTKEQLELVAIQFRRYRTTENPIFLSHPEDLEIIESLIQDALDPWNYNMDEAPRDGTEFLCVIDGVRFIPSYDHIDGNYYIECYDEYKVDNVVTTGAFNKVEGFFFLGDGGMFNCNYRQNVEGIDDEEGDVITLRMKAWQHLPKITKENK